MFGFIVYVLLFIFYSYADETICKNNVTGKNGCCADYYRTNSGSCKPCIGFFGQKCTTPCFFGYYGHGCRKTCNCSSDTHWCDSKSGCVKKDRLQYHDQIYNLEDGEIDTCENNNALESYTLVLTAVGSICVASVFWIMLGLFCRFQWYTDRSGHESDKGNQIIEVNEHSGYRYSESQFIDPDRESSRNSSDYDRIERSTFPTKTLSTNSQQNSTKTLPTAKFQQNSRTKLRRSQSLLDGNRRFDRYSDDYNHLDFYRKSTIPKRPVTDENYNKLKAMTSHPYKNLKLGEYKERDSYISLGIDETLLVSGSDFMNINTKDMDLQKGHSSTTNEKETRRNNVQSDAYIATDHTVDEICSNT